MKILPILERCINIERRAGEVYDRLAARLPVDEELHGFWSRMAADERKHARNLETYCAIVAGEDPQHPTLADGFEDTLIELERLTGEALERASCATSADEAFGIALDLELSELDTIYTTLLRSSPLTLPRDGSYAPSDLAPHHAALVGAIRARSQNEDHLTRAALIAARDRTAQHKKNPED
jgi:hypothetical protein